MSGMNFSGPLMPVIVAGLPCYSSQPASRLECTLPAGDSAHGWRRQAVSTLCTLFLSMATARAQVATGTPPFGSFSGGPEIINNANLNVHLDIPVLSKSGRGTPFTYLLTYDSSIWTPVTSGSTTVWTPVADWGLQGITTAPMGYVTYGTTAHTCTYMGTQYNWNIYAPWIFHDQRGVGHYFNISTSNGTCGLGGGQSSASGTTLDGTGHYISVTGTTNLAPITTRGGMGFTTPVVPSGTSPTSASCKGSNQPSGTTCVSDTNGNLITSNVSGGTTSFFDSLNGSTAALAISGSGTPSSPVTYTYTAASGSQATVTVNYLAYTVQSNFGCSGITEFVASSKNLVHSVVLPDGASYTFGYETTPGHSPNVTGRIASIQLPTGGTISYTYSGGTGAGGSGIICADGSTATVARATPDGTWTYAHSESGSAWTTTLTDPNSKVTTIHFQGIYETSRTLPDSLGSSTTCYNGASAPCDSTAVTLPITQRTVTPTLGSVTSRVTTLYDSTSMSQV